jgi:lysine 6-dehydrogenase
MPRLLVLGAGIVGSAAVWDLVRRGHDVTVADADGEVAELVAAEFGATAMSVDVTDGGALADLVSGYVAVVSAVPYRFGVAVATAAIEARAHYLDFGGNPSVVAAQRGLDSAARTAGVAVIPDCGLAPGVANVLAEDLIRNAPQPIESIQIRVGALPQHPRGALGYQLAFNPVGLINEYAEPCEIITDHRYATVEPLTRFEDVVWDGWGPLEAFSTAGGTSTMCHRHVGAVENLEYKTLRYPGHGLVFRALLEMGLFGDEPLGRDSTPPREVLEGALARSLPSGEPDVVLVRVSREAGGGRRVVEIEDVHDGRFSALARTTAFPATALMDLIVRGDLDLAGVHAMCEAVSGPQLMSELDPVGIVATER